jgi:hypothetical protein
MVVELVEEEHRRQIAGFAAKPKEPFAGELEQELCAMTPHR